MFIILTYSTSSKGASNNNHVRMLFRLYFECIVSNVCRSFPARTRMHTSVHARKGSHMPQYDVAHAQRLCACSHDFANVRCSVFRGCIMLVSVFGLVLVAGRWRWPHGKLSTLVRVPPRGDRCVIPVTCMLERLCCVLGSANVCRVVVRVALRFGARFAQNEEGGGVRDPAKHDFAFLQGFLMQYESSQALAQGQGQRSSEFDMGAAFKAPLLPPRLAIMHHSGFRAMTAGSILGHTTMRRHLPAI